MKKTIMIIITVMLLNLCSTYVFANENLNLNYYPTNASEWVRKSILKAKIVNIADESILCDYDKDITREEFCKLIVNVYIILGGEIPEESEEDVYIPFLDTDNAYVWLAYDIGIVNGTSETEFSPYEKITREQMAVMMNRFVELMNYRFEQREDLTAFEDYNQISPWAEDSLSALLSSNIIKGVSETQIAPKENVSREQAIVMAQRLYAIMSQKGVLLYEETSPEILTELGIISEEDINKGEHITTLEALKSIAQVGYKIGYNRSRLSQWYVGDTLSSMDYLDDDTKLLLLDLCSLGRNDILTYKDIPSLNLNSDITNYEALLYITRLVGDTYGCTDSVTEHSAAKENVYETAYEKGLISSADPTNSDELILREEFYNILHKALFVEFQSGGYTLQVLRLIDMLQNHEEKVEQPKSTELIELPISANIKDDLSVEWVIPDEYSFLLNGEYYTKTSFLGKDGTVNSKSSATEPLTNYDGAEFIEYLIQNPTGKWNAIRCEYYKYSQSDVDVRFYFDIDISNIKIITEGEEINPGIYTTAVNKWPAKKISLAEGNAFEKDCYYVLKDYEKKYRKPEYNSVSYEVFKAKENGNVFTPPTNRSVGVSNLDEIHIQKVTIKKDSENNYILSITPESTNTFTREELPV